MTNAKGLVKELLAKRIWPFLKAEGFQRRRQPELSFWLRESAWGVLAFRRRKGSTADFMPLSLHFGVMHPAVRAFAPHWPANTPPSVHECAVREGFGGVVVESTSDLDSIADTFETYLRDVGIPWLRSLITDDGFRKYWLDLPFRLGPGQLLLVEMLLSKIGPPDELARIRAEIADRADEISEHIAEVNAARGSGVPHLELRSVVSKGES